MGLKKYIFGSLVLAVAIFAYTFVLVPGDYRIEIFDKVVILPVAIWVILPMLVLFVLTILHILFYGIKNYFSIKAITKDSDSLVSLVNKKLLNESSKLNFQNKDIKEIASILEQLDIDVTNSDFSTQNKDVNQTIDQIFAIKSGKYISAKELKLDSNNPLMIENLKNRISQDEDFALDIVKKNGTHSPETIKEAVCRIIDTKSMTTIKKLLEEITFDEDIAVKLLKKDAQQEDQFAMTNEQVLSIIKKVELSNEQLITIAKNYKTLMSPDQMIKLYEDLSVHNEEYTFAYLFVLAEYEMIDKMRDILDNSATDEFLPFKALVDLKDSGKNTYSLDSICYK